MKQTFLLSFCLIFSSALLQSQITINSDDILPIGYVADQTRDTIPDASILEGGVGNIDWDFGALQPGLDVEFVLLDIDSTPYAASFPNTNLATQVEQGLFAYMIKDNDKIEIVGLEGQQDLLGFPIQGQLEVNPGQSLIRFPATTGESYTETVVQQGQVTGASLNFPAFDSVRLVNTVERNVEIDAWGNMTIPSGTYETIRSSETETTSREVFALSGGTWSPFGAPDVSTLINYNWWTIDDGRAFPVVSMEYDPEEETREVIWLVELSDVVNLFETTATLFPNPTTDFVNIEFGETFNGQIQVFNNNGQLMTSLSVTESTFQKIELTNFVDGNYFLVLKNTDGRFVGHKKIIVTH